MGAEFKTVKLGDVVKRVKRTHSVLADRTYDLLGVRWYSEGAHLHSTEDGGELKTKTLYEVRAGDITYNKMWVTKGAFAVVDDALDSIHATSEYPTFEPDPQRVDVGFLRWLMSTPQFVTLASAFCNGTTQRARLHPKDFLRLKVNLPPLPEQKKIAAILASVDEAIDATEAVIEQTRRVKKGLLQELLTRGIGHTEFKKTAIGEIPKGWEVKRLKQLLSFGPQNGLSPTSTEANTGVVTFSIAAVRDGVTNPQGHERFADITVDDAESYWLEPGDILVIRGNGNQQLVGRCGIVVDDAPEGCIFPDILMRIRPNELVRNGYLATVINSKLVHDQVLVRAKTTNGTYKINQKDLGSLQIPVPPLVEQERMMRVLDGLSGGQQASRAQLDEARRLKRGLLQDLLTGKVRVNVDEGVEEVREAAALAE